METGWIEDFLALLEAGTFSRAAEQRHVTQPAFGRRIRALEQWVGASLFDRSGSRVMPTPAALALRLEAEEALRRLRQGRCLAREADQSGAATLTFASTHFLSSSFFPRWLPSIEAGLSLDMHLQVIVDNMMACERLLRSGGARVLLCHHHGAAPADLDPSAFVRLTVGRDVLVPVSAPGRGRKPLHAVPERPGSDASLLAYRPESGLGRILQGAGQLDRLGGALVPSFHSHAALTLAALARDGRGLAWLPHTAVADDLAAGTVVRAGDETWDVPVEICLLRPAFDLGAAFEAFWNLARLSEAPEDDSHGHRRVSDRSASRRPD